jgi:putative inorganic carbon (HCO3(-)) transporter
MDRKIPKIFYWSVAAILLIPLIYSRLVVYSFVTAKDFWLQALVELALPFYVYLLVVNKQYRPNLKNPLTILVLAYFGVNLFSGFFGVNRSQSFWGIPARGSGVFNLAHFVMLYFYLLLIGKIDDDLIEKLLRMLVWVSGIAAIYGIWEKIGLPKFFADSFLPRASSFFGNPIFFASFLVIPTFLAVLLASNEDRKVHKYLYIGIAALDLIGIYISKTRGAYLGLLFGAVTAGVLFFALNESKKIRNYSLAVLFFVILAGGFVGYKKVHFTDNDSRARLLLWQVALHGFKDHPVLGTGPENFYVVANKYYDPSLYNFDSEWWDKPHNVSIESLITTGVLGLATYVGVVLSALLGLWLAFRKGLVERFEFAILAGALVSFQVQNFFVFDTAAASLSFFFLLGLIGYFWPEQKQAAGSKPHRPLWAKLLFWGSSVAVAIMIYFANLVPLEAFYYVNKAILVGHNHPEQSWPYLALASQFTHDPTALADIGAYAEQYATTAIHQQSADTGYLQQNVKDALSLWEKVTVKIQNDPTYWLKIGNLYYSQAFLSDQKDEAQQKSEAALQKSIDLAPNRVEAKLLLAKLRAGEGRISDTEQIMSGVMQILPTDPNSSWHYKQKKDALTVYDLLIRYYAPKADYGKILGLYMTEIKLDPNNYELYSGLAATYAKLGDRENAINASHRVVELNPAAADDVQKFLKTLE